jgi:hypothetical protein
VFPTVIHVELELMFGVGHGGNHVKFGKPENSNTPKVAWPPLSLKEILPGSSRVKHEVDASC